MLNVVIKVFLSIRRSDISRIRAGEVMMSVFHYDKTRPVYFSGEGGLMVAIFIVGVLLQNFYNVGT